jgi:hypothetical protein
MPRWSITFLIQCPQIQHFRHEESDGSIRDGIHFAEKGHAIMLENYPCHPQPIISRLSSLLLLACESRLAGAA